MSRVSAVLASLAPAGVPYSPIGDPTVSRAVVAGATPKAGVDNWENGTIPWMSSGEVNRRTIFATDKMITQAAYDSTSTKMVPAGAVVVALAGQGKTRGSVARTRIDLCTNQSLASIVVADSMLSDFLWHFLRSKYKQLREVSSGDGGRGGLNLKLIRAFRVPVPPVEVQQGIVRILDHFTELHAELESELEAELAARRQQYEHYRRRLISRRHRKAMTLGEIGPVRMCKRVFKNETTADGDVPFFKIGTFGGQPDAFISRELFDRYRRLYSFPRPGEVLISAAGTIGRAVVYDGRDAYFQDSNIVWIENDETRVTNRYLRHLYELMDWSTDGGTIRRLYNDRIRNTPINVPSLAEQELIAESLDGFELLLTDLAVGLPAELAARRRQYEYYRDKLLTFEEAK